MNRILAALLLVVALGTAASAHFNLPPLASRDEYGNILLNRTSTQNGVQPVTFSHWQHRKYYTCRVCHTELDFNMKANTTEITERDNRNGRYCGACHNGKLAFRPNGNCDKCHNGNIAYGANKFEDFFQQPFATTGFGNGINWVDALERKLIKPATYLKKKSQDINFDKLLILEAEWSIISPSVFPHKAHIAWLDCSSCHPEIFNIKKKTTKHFTMSAMLSGDFCGVCHLNVAFPMDDCQRCHPGMKEDARE
jgi:c(7)-type cytochrome triheme protein